MDIDGRSAAYFEAGTGEPVLYLHGFPTSGYLWRKVMDVVSNSYRAIAPDLPGFGDSDLLSKPHSWGNLKGWIGSFVEALDLRPVHLAVHDWGGLIGLPWFCDNPDAVSSLLITDTSFNSKDRWHALASSWREEGTGEEAMAALNREGFDALMTMGSPSMSMESIAEYFKCVSTEERRAAKLEMYRSLDFEMFEPYMPKFPELARGRSRVVWGRNDVFVPRKVADRFGTRIGAEVTVFDDAGHFLQEDAGELVGKIHMDFLNSMSY